MMPLYRLNELHAMYREKYGQWECWHPTVEEAEQHVRECLIEIDSLKERLAQVTHATRLLRASGDIVSPD